MEDFFGPALVRLLVSSTVTTVNVDMKVRTVKWSERVPDHSIWRTV